MSSPGIVRHTARGRVRSAAALGLAIATTTAVYAPRLRAQVVPGRGAAIGSLGADRARLDQISGAPPEGGGDSTGTERWRAIAPTVLIVRNSDLPMGGNDGALWAGRGMNVSITTGVTIRQILKGVGAELDIAPVVTYSQNETFQIIPGRQSGRSAFSSPWHLGTASADLPLRFGDEPLRTIGLGQSAFSLRSGPIEVGASAKNEWWGPGLRTSLILSNNAGGIPRLYASTARPLRTRIALVSARMFVGELTESPFFDVILDNNTRAASGFLLSVRPLVDTNLTMGVSRLVLSPITSNFAFVSHVVDALTYWHPTKAPDDTLPNGQSAQTHDQMTATFARWIFPESGFEVFGELARTELPRSVREFLEAPQSTQAYTLGTQWSRSLGGMRRFRIQAELGYLEQTLVWSDRTPMDYYTGRATAQGFTERGQVLGASSGPGSSTQFLASDWIERAWQVGVLLGRTRTENDALYRQRFAADTRHDVTYMGGIRGGKRFSATDVSVEIIASHRLNYLFQSQYEIARPVFARDVSNLTLSLRMDPR
ncbi:hypothetical protein BH09GEM1_BH09GEM1_04610 [soil metagenome]